MHIRLATPADLSAMRRIEAQAPTAAHWNDSEYERLFSGDPTRLALVIGEDAVQAFLIAQQVGPEWELENMVVAADAQRRGLASALLGYFLDWVRQRGGDRIFLEVRESNAPARALYVKHGFVETGRRRLYYQDPAEDAVLYQKGIGSP